MILIVKRLFFYEYMVSVNSNRFSVSCAGSAGFFAFGGTVLEAGISALLHVAPFFFDFISKFFPWASIFSGIIWICD